MKAFLLFILAIVLCAASTNAYLDSFPELSGTAVDVTGNSFDDLFFVMDAATREAVLKAPLRESVDDDAKIIAQLLANPELPAFRASNAMKVYGMTVEEYDAKFEAARQSLLAVAGSLNIKVDVASTTFSSLLAEVEDAMKTQPESLLKDMNTELITSLHKQEYLFEMRYNLHTAQVQDAMLTGLNDLIEKAINWSVSKISENKCSWCKRSASFIRDKACDKAGKFMCNLLVTAATQEFAPIATKYICDSSYANLATAFSSICEKGIERMQKWKHASDDCICSVTIPNFTFGPIDKFGIHIQKHTIAFGQICKVDTSKCF